jgi:hypothetical protein
MSGSASLDLERLMLGHTLAIAPMPTLARVYVALCQTAPTEAAGGEEVTGAGYARPAATFTLLAVPANAAANATAVDFAPATGDWGTVTHFEIWTQATGGTRLYWGQLVDPADSVPIEIEVTAGNVLRFSPGTLVVQATDMDPVVIEDAGPFLPTAGGTMTGPLLYTATGGIGLRPAQDRAADVANVLDYGADPTGVADCTAAFNAAAAQLASNGLNKAVYFPTGTYRINGQISLTKCQGMFGDSRGSSVLVIDDKFSPTDTCVIMCSAASYDAGPELRNFGITFAQPSDQTSRANFKTLAEGGTSGAGGTGVKYPWAIASGSDNFRIKIANLRIAGAWDGITTNNHNTVFWIESVEIGALGCGVSLGEGAAVQDFGHINGLHAWNFGFGGSLINIFNDGETVALRVGRHDGLEIRDLSVFWGRVIFTGANADSGATSCNITNCLMDGYTSSIEILGNGINHLHIANFYGSAGTGRPRPLLSVAASAYVTITNWYSHSSSPVPDIALTHGGANVIISSFQALYHSLTASWATVSAGHLQLLGGWLYPDGVRTAPAILQSANGWLTIDNVKFYTVPGVPSSGDVISVTGTASQVSIGSIQLGAGWTVNLPGVTRTIYSTTTVKGSLFAENSMQAGLPGGGAVSFALTGAAGQQKSVIFYSGNSIRWAMLSSGATDDLSIGRWNDAGTFLGAALSINRANGTVGFNNTTPPAAKPIVSGAKGGNAALASLLTALAAYGLITDSST